MAIGVLVHELSPCTVSPRQQPSAQQLVALGRQHRWLQRLAQPFGQPLRQVRLLTRTHLHRMALFGREHGMRHARLTNESSLGLIAQQRSVDRLPQAPQAPAQCEGHQHAGGQATPAPPAISGCSLATGSHQGVVHRRWYGFFQHIGVQIAQQAALSKPALQPGGGVGLLLQPQDQRLACVQGQLLVDEGVQFFVADPGARGRRSVCVHGVEGGGFT